MIGLPLSVKMTEPEGVTVAPAGTVTVAVKVRVSSTVEGLLPVVKATTSMCWRLDGEPCATGASGEIRIGIEGC